VVLAMIVLSAIGMGAAAEGDGNGRSCWCWATGLAMLAFVVLFIRYVANPLVPNGCRARRSCWCLRHRLGGASGRGRPLSRLRQGTGRAARRRLARLDPVREAIAARLASLRDFLLLFFFIALGASLDLSVLGASVGPAIVLSLFVLIGNPLIVLAIMGAMGYRKRTGFLAGLTVAQISEFSLIFMAMGVAIGHVGGGGAWPRHAGRPRDHRRSRPT
jgi:hypothetical protein